MGGFDWLTPVPGQADSLVAIGCLVQLANWTGRVHRCRGQLPASCLSWRAGAGVLEDRGEAAKHREGTALLLEAAGRTLTSLGHRPF